MDSAFEADCVYLEFARDDIERQHVGEARRTPVDVASDRKDLGDRLELELGGLVEIARLELVATQIDLDDRPLARRRVDRIERPANRGTLPRLRR